jgi:hypothetical protein
VRFAIEARGSSLILFHNRAFLLMSLSKKKSNKKCHAKAERRKMNKNFSMIKHKKHLPFNEKKKIS